MTDLDDDLLRSAFSEYREQTHPHVRAAGMAAVSDGVRRLRRTRHAIVAVVVAVIALPIAAYAIAARPTAHPGPVPGTQEPTPTISPSPQATATPVPSGGFSEDDLKNATITVPAWDDTSYPQAHCASGRRTFTDGYSQPWVHMHPEAYADVDHDGQSETVVRLFCGAQAGEFGPDQVVVLGRDGAGGIRTFGQAVTTANGIVQIGGIVGLGDGTFKVEVLDAIQYVATLFTEANHQWRTYAWDGNKIVQSAGATAFPAAASLPDLVVTVSDIAFNAPDASGVREGRMTVTVRLANQVRLPDWELVVRARNTTLTPSFSPSPLDEESRARRYGALCCGESQTIELTFTTREREAGDVYIWINAIGISQTGDYLRDRDPSNNEDIERPFVTFN